MTAQDHEMRGILLRLELLSHGATQAWNPSGGQSGEPDDRIITILLIHDTPPHIHYRNLYEQQQTHADRETIITQARDELKHWTGHTPRPRIEGKTLVELILEDGEGWEPEIVAQRFGVDPGFVRRKRMVAGYDTETGKASSPTITEPADRLERAKDLRQRGLSTRQIALILGCHQTQVMRWIKKAAA